MLPSGWPTSSCGATFRDRIPGHVPGQVRVWQADKRRAQSVDVAKVPDVFVLLMLVETIRAAMQRT
ncbi:hypothetical protein GCM10023320_40060 [Pseudonocardia adelaidensis]|uniref:Uncharacterized protein n=1 Tax=Pseudonocardia adelaidensis TaxID=648754 RepID=A0ABP9NRQ7_9PSEU